MATTRGWRVWLLTLLGVLGLLVGAAPVAGATGDAGGGSIGIRLLEVPVARSDDLRAHSYIVDHVPPGTTFTRRVEVTNDTGDTREIEFYPGPAQIRDDAWIPAEPGTESELTRWISADESVVTLAPRESREVSVAFDIPRDATAGERYGVLWAATRSTEPGDIQMVSRVGIRVYLSVGQGGEPPTDFTIVTLLGTRGDDGSLQVRAEVRNTGERAIDVRGALRLRDGPGGTTAGPFDSEQATPISPGETGEVVTLLDADLPLGPWTVVQRAVSGRETRTARAELTLPAPGEGPVAERAVPEGGGLAWWWLVPLLIALAALLLVGWRRRRHAAEEAAAPPPSSARSQPPGG